MRPPFSDSKVSCNELIEARDQLSAMIAEDQILESLLEQYNYDGWLEFREKVLQAEEMRLAREGMKIPVEKHDKRLVCTGQYEEIRKILQRPEEINAMRHELKQKIAEQQRAIEKLEKRIKNA